MGVGVTPPHVLLSQTRASHSEMPHGVPRVSLVIRTYRALRAENVCTFKPGEPVDTFATVDHALDRDLRIRIRYRDA
jgi:hypothetical protein